MYVLLAKLFWTSRSYVKHKPHVIIRELTPSISKRAFDVTKAYPKLQSYKVLSVCRMWTHSKLSIIGFSLFLPWNNYRERKVDFLQSKCTKHQCCTQPSILTPTSVKQGTNKEELHSVVASRYFPCGYIPTQFLQCPLMDVFVISMINVSFNIQIVSKSPAPGANMI